jgi:UDP-N-acetylmuramoyl-tripeptide--D-alanyl-D-alanine ligase
VSELRLDLGWIAEAVHGTLRSGDARLLIGDVVTDSRALRPGDLFIALKGPRFDGHAFVADVLSRGAAGAIVAVPAGGSTRTAPDAGSGLIEVYDTLMALQALGRAVRTAARSRVVAITGSTGKTTTKEIIADFLSTRFRVVKNKGNLNNHIGLPLSLVALRTNPDVAVMELGMNHRGEISTLVAIAEPDVRVWTNVGDAHLGFFASAEAIADAKAEILEGADATTVLVCNHDDPRVMARVGGFPGRTTTFGVSPGSDVRAVDVEDRGLLGTRARVISPAGERRMEIPLLGPGNLSNVLAATAVSLDLGAALDDIAERVVALAPAPRRGTVRRLRDDVVLIDDSYNSSPSALKGALAVLSAETGARRKVAVLGEMLELGEHAIDLHEECGRAVVDAGVSLLYAVGGTPARALADAAIAVGLEPSAAHWVQTSEAAADVIAPAIQPGDLVLVKGSRGTRTDIVADRVAAECA